MLMNVIVGIWREFGNEEGRKKEETVSADCDISCPSHTVIFTRLFPFFSFSLQYNQRVLFIFFFFIPYSKSLSFHFIMLRFLLEYLL
jgi:hypothetical protein